VNIGAILRFVSTFLSPFLINIYQDKEPDQNTTSENFSVVQKEGKIMPGDVVITKNYLDNEELKDLDRIGNMYLDYAEMQAARGKVMKMKDWQKKLDAFLKFSKYEILTDAGKVSHEIAKELTLGEYAKYKPIRDKNYISDFDQKVKNL